MPDYNEEEVRKFRDAVKPYRVLGLLLVTAGATVSVSIFNNVALARFCDVAFRGIRSLVDCSNGYAAASRLRLFESIGLPVVFLRVSPSDIAEAMEMRDADEPTARAQLQEELKAALRNPILSTSDVKLSLTEVWPPNNPFDVALCVDTLSLMDRDSACAYLSDIRRGLKNGGRIVIIDYHCHGILIALERLLPFVPFVPKTMLSAGLHDHRHWTIDGLQLVDWRRLAVMGRIGAIYQCTECSNAPAQCSTDVG